MRNTPRLPYLLLLCGLLGCERDLRLEDSTAESEADSASCWGIPFPREPVVTNPTSATLIGEYLYVAGALDGANVVAILQLDEDGKHANLVRYADELAPYPHDLPWNHVLGSVYARYHDQQVDVLEASDPTHPKTETVYLDWPTNYSAQSALGVSNGRVFGCGVEAESGENRLFSIDLSSFGDLGEPTLESSTACSAPSFGASGAAGALWADWEASDGEAVDSMQLYTLGASPQSVLHHSFNANGVHAYGGLERVVVGSKVVAGYTYNPDYLFLYYAEPSPGGTVFYANNPGRIDFIVESTGFGLNEEENGDTVLRSFELGAPETLTKAGQTRLKSDEYSAKFVIGYDATRAVITGYQHELFVVTLGANEEVSPLIVGDEETPPACP